jgi:4-amino-4-deoxy-L-arabinose transferase-like glycosyltransferase
LALLVWTTVVAVTGGFSLALGPLHMSSHRVLPPLLAALLAYLGTHRLAGAHIEDVWSKLRSTLHALAPPLAALVTALVVAIGIAHTSRVAGGSDSYGYVSQAELWMRGQLIQTDPLAFSLANRVSPHVFAPLGYRVGPRRGSIVPTYPPGLPLLMAAAGLALGREAIFLVVPVCGGLLVALTYTLGRFFGDRFTGLLSAGLLASNPVFLLQLIQPMSDVPASAAWTAAVALGLGGSGAWTALGSGLAVSIAILIRPNLVPLAAAVALLVWQRPSPRRLRRVAAFATGLVPGAVTLAAVSHALYGSPFLSGYGNVGPYFALSHVAPNLVLYARWLVETQGPFVFLALLAPLVWRRGGPDLSGRPRPPLAAFIAFGGVLVAVYALYLTFENWTFVRFLLPGLPIALALAVASARAGLRGLGAAFRVPAVVALVVVPLAWGLGYASTQNVLQLSVSEARHVTVARYVARTLPERSAILCMMHSGSLRYYAQRETLRFDWLGPTRLEPLLDRLERRGYHTYFVLEVWEEPLFRKRFAAHTSLGALDWPPVARLNLPAVVSIYDPRDRERHLRQEVLTTQAIE